MAVNSDITKKINENVGVFTTRYGVDLLYRDCIEEIRKIAEKIIKQEWNRIGSNDARVVNDFINRWGKCHAPKIDEGFLKEILEVFKDSGARDLLKREISDINILENSVTNLFNLMQSKKSKFKRVATSKLLHALNPKLFIPWDTAIINYYKQQYYGFRKTLKKSDGFAYSYFLRKMNEIISEIDPDVLLHEIIIKIDDLYLSRLIDCYNWVAARINESNNKKTRDFIKTSMTIRNTNNRFPKSNS